jgi:hypothetical protein
MKALARWILSLLIPWSAQAQMLDWDEVDWTRGANSETFSDVQGTGIDISIGLTLSNDKNKNQVTQWSPYGTASPDDNNTFGGDWGKKDGESLYLKPDFASDNRERSYLDVTISFSQSVSNVQFSLFDIDVGLWYTRSPGLEFEDIIEQISGSHDGQSVDASVDAGNRIIVDNSTDPGNTLYRGNTSTSDSGQDQNDNPGSVIRLTFSDPVDTINFRYSSGNRAEWNPGDQAIGMSDISFSAYNAVPEPSTVLGSILMIAAIGFFGYRRYKTTQSAA